MGSKQVCQHYKDSICRENNAAPTCGNGALSYLLSALKGSQHGLYRAEEDGRGSCWPLQKKPEGSGHSRASKDQFSMALGCEDDLLHAFTGGS